jgi:hypothetical protein
MGRLRKAWLGVALGALVALLVLASWIVQRQSVDGGVDSPRTAAEQAPPRELPAEVAAPKPSPPGQVAEARPASPDAPPRVQPFRWSATSRDGEIVVSGHVPSAGARDEVRRAAGEAFPGKQLVDGLEVANGSPPHLEFGAVTRFALSQLADLRAGSVELLDSTLSLRGEGTDRDAPARAVAALRKSLPGGAEAGVVAVTVTPPSPYVFAARRETGALILTGYVPDEAARDAIRQLVRTRFLTEPLVDKLRYASGAPRGYLAGVSFGLEQLSGLASGELNVNGTTLRVSGESLYAQAAEQAARTISAVSLPGWTGRADIKVVSRERASAAP